MSGYGDHEDHYDDEITWATASRRKRWGLIGFAALAVVLVVGVCSAGLVLAKGRDQPSTRDAAGTRSPVSSSAVAASGVASTVAPTPTAAATSATPSPTTKAAPSKNPKATLPPPPAPPPPAPPGCVPTQRGTAASYAAVRAALKVSAGHTYWASVPSIKVPERLLIAVAMTESSWRSNVIACDGGIGLMQVMPDTVTQINNRFGTTWNVNTLQGNAHLGANYLAWSIRYLGDLYFGGSYDLGNRALMDSVIAAYNYGAGAVDPTKGAAGIPNPGYVNQVRQYMASCPCDAW
jgi:soluble lytic murein transglycosylase-like protein